MIEIKGLRKTVGGRDIVDGISLTIQKGSVFGFLGPNGAGKTTTMKMLVGLNTPTWGDIRINGLSPSEASTREIIGFMPEAPYFYDQLTGFEFLMFCASLFHGERRSHEECMDILKLVGLFEAAHERIVHYSKGMKQRLGFAQAIVNDPEYVFLDEPLDGLDPIGRRALKKIIKELKGQGKTIFFNSHILFDTEELCDEIGVLHHGSLLYAGKVSEFTRGQSLEERFVHTIEHLQTV